VPLIARWPGKIPAGHVSHAVAGTIDVFPTVLKLAGVPLPQDRVIDGRDIMPLLSRDAASPHEAIFAMHGPRLCCVRSGKWKLHVLVPGPRMLGKQLTDWVDPRGPDGVTILAPHEQYQPIAHPGITTGERPKGMMLVDLQSDPSEQHDVAAEQPEVVERLKGMFQKMEAQVPLQLRRPRAKAERAAPKQ
jgi:uncharacterized sulfatase